MSRRNDLARQRLLAAARRLDPAHGDGLAALGRLLLGAPESSSGALAPSRLNSDGSPLQLCLTAGPDAATLRLIGDPGAGVLDRAQQLEWARAALQRTFDSRAAELTAVAGDALERIVGFEPNGDEPLARFASGIAWLAAAPAGPGAGLYLDVRAHGVTRGWRAARAWLEEALPSPAAAIAALDTIEPVAEPASVALEGRGREDARAKVYFRLREPSPLSALGIDLFSAPVALAFLERALADRTLERDGLVLGAGFRLADGALSDVKLDVCGHCLAYERGEWAALIGALTADLGLAPLPVADALADGDLDVSFVGLRVDAAGSVRLNLYLKAAANGGRLTDERLAAALADAVTVLGSAQRADGAFVDYDLPVGSSDQWVTAYTGRALAEADARAGVPAAADAARRAARWLDAHHCEPGGWGFNGSTGADADSTAFALALRRRLGLPQDERDLAVIAEQWRDGGVATYDGPGGWGVAHVDVTPLAFLALPAAERQRRLPALLDFLRRTRRDDGVWPSYWWRGATYATFQVLALLDELGLDEADLPWPVRVPRLAASNAFELACAAGVELLRAGPGDRLDTALSELLALQRPDGRWSGSENLRVTDDSVTEASEDAPGACYADSAGLVTTATAVEVIARALAACRRPGHTRRAARRGFVDAELEQQLQRSGYVVADLLNATDVRRLRDLYARCAEHHHNGISYTIVDRDGDYRRAVHAEAAAILGAPLARLLDDFRLVHAGFVVKSPHSEDSGMDLHQDLSVVHEPYLASLTVWCPLVDVGPDNGWLGIVEGSHVLDQRLRAAGAFDYPELAPVIHERYVRHLALRAGQAVLMHPALFHASPPNRADEPRVVAAAIAAPAEAQLIYCHRDRAAGDRIAVYQVDAGFYEQHVIGTRPAGRPVRTIAPPAGSLDARHLEQLVAVDG